MGISAFEPNGGHWIHDGRKLRKNAWFWGASALDVRRAWRQVMHPVRADA